MHGWWMLMELLLILITFVEVVVSQVEGESLVGQKFKKFVEHIGADLGS